MMAFTFGVMFPHMTRPQRQADGMQTAAAKRLPSVRIDKIPHVRQRPDFCGEACVAMALGKLGHGRVTQNDVFNAAKLDPTLGRGCYAPDLYRAIDALGFEPGSKDACWQTMTPETHQARLEKLFAALHADLASGHPSIVCMYYDDPPKTTEHFRLIVGYDAETDEVLYHEPAEADGAYRRMSRKQFLKLWPLKGPETWTAIRFRLKPGDLNLPPRHQPKVRRVLDADGKAQEVPVPEFTDADYAQHIRTLRQTYPMKDMTVAVEPPFVVVGNQAPEKVNRWAAGTIRWATKQYRKDYFAYDPDHIITIWLLGDAKTYAAITQAVSGREPTTPYGFYLRHKAALVMNIATGGGTLVHEMFHAFVSTNFPTMPPWLNEGLASLYEQCGDRDGQIVGYTNWRLAGLKKAIAGHKTLSFKDLCSLDIPTFYGRGSGVHYAQARYLCYYLQEKGLLRTFYRGFQANRFKDPTGYTTLLKTLEIDDADAFLSDWQTWCLKLEFNG